MHSFRYIIISCFGFSQLLDFKNLCFVELLNRQRVKALAIHYACIVILGPSDFPSQQKAKVAPILGHKVLFNTNFCGVSLFKYFETWYNTNLANLGDFV